MIKYLISTMSKPHFVSAHGLSPGHVTCPRISPCSSLGLASFC